MKKQNIVVLTLVLIFVFGLFSLWQYSIYQKLSKTDMSCGGDWSYNVRCPIGSYCQSLGQGPLAGGLCKPFLSPMFDIFSKFKSTTTGQNSLTPIPTQSIAPTKSAIPDDTTKNWKTYLNESYGFTFKHPDLDESCCNISGPLTGKPQRIIVLADKSTTVEGTDKPFNGIGVYVEPNAERATFQNYVEKQKENLLQNYREFTDREAADYKEIPIVIDGKNGVLLKNYAWWADMIYIPFPDNQKILILAKTEATREGFNSVFNQILSTFRFIR